MNKKNSLMMLSIITSMFLFAAHDTLTHGGGGGGGGHSHGGGGGGHSHGGGGGGVGVGIGVGVGLADAGYYDGDYEDYGPVVEEEIVEEGGYRGGRYERGRRR